MELRRRVPGRHGGQGWHAGPHLPPLRCTPIPLITLPIRFEIEHTIEYDETMSTTTPGLVDRPPRSPWGALDPLTEAVIVDHGEDIDQVAARDPMAPFLDDWLAAVTAELDAQPTNGRIAAGLADEGQDGSADSADSAGVWSGAAGWQVVVPGLTELVLGAPWVAAEGVVSGCAPVPEPRRGRRRTRSSSRVWIRRSRRRRGCCRRVRWGGRGRDWTVGQGLRCRGRRRCRRRWR